MSTKFIYDIPEEVLAVNLNPPENENYGYPFPEGMPQYHKELYLYSILRGRYGKKQQKLLKRRGIDIDDFDLKSPFQHLINAIRLNWPDKVNFQERGYRNTNLLEVLHECCYNDDVGFAGNASSGKTFGIALWILTDWNAAPQCTTSLLGSTALEASEDRIWGTVTDLFQTAKYKVGELIQYRRVIVYGGIDKDDPGREYKNSIKAIAFEDGNEGIKAIASTRGRKNERFRVAIDELAEMGLKVNDIRANLRANKDLVYFGIGNPAHGNNPHKELCMPDDPMGYGAVNKNMRKWKTRTGWCLFLSGERSPNFQAPENEDPPFDYLLTRRGVKEILEACYGNDKSLEYWRNAIGFWPETGVELTVLSKAFIKSVDQAKEPHWTQHQKRTIAGFDLGFTSGGDKCCCSYFVMGTETTGRKVLKYVVSRYYDADVGEVFEQSIARKLVADLIAAGVTPEDFGMDISGDGGKMLQSIIIEWLKYDSRATGIIPISSMVMLQIV